MASIYGTAYTNFPPNVVGTSEISKLSSSVANAVTSAIEVLYIKSYISASGDQTENVRLAHTFANANNLPVSYAGISTIQIDANAQIIVNTSVDFAGCIVEVLNGVEGGTITYPLRTMFRIYDSNAALVTLTNQSVTSPSTSLARNSMYPTRGVFDGIGYAKVTAPLLIPDRATTGSTNYAQVFRIGRLGRASTALATDLTAFNGQLTISYRPYSAKTVTISNFVSVETGWNNQSFFLIERCNVVIENTNVTYTTTGVASIDVLININNASDIYINNFTTTGRTTGTEGTYCLGIAGGADIFVDSMSAKGGWGATGTNDVNNVMYTRCVLNRVDCHFGGFNIHVQNCDIGEYGVMYGCGGGLLTVKNCRIYEASQIVTYRGDYGGWFDGNIIVSDCELINRTTYSMGIVTLANVGASTVTTRLPNLRVSNITLSGDNTGAVGQIIAAHVFVKNPSTAVQAPFRVLVNNITHTNMFHLRVSIDWANMERHPRGNSTMTVRDCPNSEAFFPVGAESEWAGIYDYANFKSITSAISLIANITNVNNVFVKSRLSRITLNIANCSLTAVEVPTSAGNQGSITISNSKFISAYSPFVSTYVIGSSRDGNFFTTIRNCEFSSTQAWDLSLASVLIGNTVRQGGTSIILPSNVTYYDIFNGWTDNTAVYGIPENILVKRYSSADKISMAATTGEQLIKAVLLPANCLGTKGHVKCSFNLSWAYSTATSRVVRLRLDTSASGTTGTILLERTYSSAMRSGALANYFFGPNNNTTQIKYRLTETTNGESGQAFSIASIDSTVNLYLKLTMDSQGTADIGSLEFMDVESVYRI